MAPQATSTWNQCLEFARNLGAKKMQLDGFDVQIAQAVTSVMYTYRPWSWSLINSVNNALPLVSGQQDYPAPADMWSLVQAWVTVTYPATNNQPAGIDQNYNLDVVKTLTPDLNPTGYYGRGAISYIRNYGILRLANAIQPPTSNPAFLNTTYQPRMEKVLDLSMPLPFPDEFFDVTVAGCLYWLYKFGDDERAGTVVKQGNSVEYTGQLAEFHANLAYAAANDEPSEVDTFFPADSLGHQWPWGPYPYIWVY